MRPRVCVIVVKSAASPKPPSLKSFGLCKIVAPSSDNPAPGTPEHVGMQTAEELSDVGRSRKSSSSQAPGCEVFQMPAGPSWLVDTAHPARHRVAGVARNRQPMHAIIKR